MLESPLLQVLSSPGPQKMFLVLALNYRYKFRHQLWGKLRHVFVYGKKTELTRSMFYCSPGMSLGLSIDGVWDLSLTVNVGAGIGVGGLSAGYTWGFPESQVNFTTPK